MLVKLLGMSQTGSSHCDEITDVSIKLLGMCRILNFSFYDKIIHDTVKLLGNCHILNLYGCNKIIDTC